MLEPTPPQETLRQLCAMFPTFAKWWEHEEGPPEADGLVDGVYYEWSHHRVLSEFLVYFGARRDRFDPRQIENLAQWLNDLVAAGGILENAASTSFLEHTHQVEAYAVLAPYLSEEAKARTHA